MFRRETKVRINGIVLISDTCVQAMNKIDRTSLAGSVHMKQYGREKVKSLISQWEPFQVVSSHFLVLVGHSRREQLGGHTSTLHSNFLR